jgi:signal transduction histidine kinase
MRRIRRAGDPRRGFWPYDRLVETLAARAARFGQGLAARVAALFRGLVAKFGALPPRRQERLQDLGLGLALAAVNVVSLLPVRGQLHPLWLALTLVAAQGVPLIWRRSRPIAMGLIIAAARVAYDRIGFGYAPFPLGPAIIFYTIIDRRCAVWRWIACAVVVVGVTISLGAPGHTEPYDAIFQALIFVTALAAGVLSRAKRASLQAAQTRADRAEAELDRQSSRAAVAERTRIARELHDVVAHHVSLVAVQAEAATSLLPGRPADAQNSVEIIGTTARQALTELRRLLGVLRGPSEQLETAPSASLQDLGDVLDQVRGTGLPVEFEVVGTPYPLAPGVDLTAYRIVQEALTNTVRHARADRAAVTLSYEPGYITVSIADSGRRRNGSAPGANGGAAGSPGLVLSGRSALINGSGLGLAGIAERVASCGGNLTVGPTGSGGFAVTARLPAL